MMSKACTISLLLVGLSVASVLGSAIKGQPQAQPTQRLEEQAVRAVKSPVQQHSDRSPKSSPAVPAQPNAPVLESSKKVYNDESLRVRSVQQPAVAEQAAAVKSASAPVPVLVESVAPVVGEPVKPVAAPVPAPAPAVVKESAPVVPPQVPAVAQPQPVAPVAAPPVVEGMKPTFVEQPAAVQAAAPVQPVAVKAEELPAQSERSAPVKEEAIKPSVVVVEQVVPAKAPVVEPQQAPAVIKPIEPLVPAVQPVEPIKPIELESPLMAKKDEPVAVVKESVEPIEVPAPDPGLVLSEPIDSTTKLLIDLDEHVQKFLPAEDKQEPAAPAKNQVLVSGVDYSPAEAQPSGKSNVPLVPYSSSSSNVDSEPIVPPLPSLEKVEKASGAHSSPADAAGAPASPSAGQSATRQANHQHQNQQQIITQLLDQLDSLQNRIQDTINQLVARRRYVMSALLRPMGTYVRRVRTNLERLQNRVNQLQAAASSVGSNNNQNRPSGFVDAAAIETIRRRIDDISKRTSDIVNRIRFSLTPTSAPLNNNGR